jgi:hypothetical protein
LTLILAASRRYLNFNWIFKEHACSAADVLLHKQYSRSLLVPGENKAGGGHGKRTKRRMPQELKDTLYRVLVADRMNELFVT